MDLTGAQVTLAGWFIDGGGEHLMAHVDTTGMQIPHRRIEHLEAVAAAGAAVVLDQGFHQLLVLCQGAVSHLDGDNVPRCAVLAFVQFAPTYAKTLKNALEARYLARVLSVDKGVLDALAEQGERLPLEAGDIALPCQQRQHGL